jgi:2-aminoadipate transaminase
MLWKFSPTIWQRRVLSRKFIYTVPGIKNPTALILSVKRRKFLLSITRERGVPIVKDECYADLLWDEEWPDFMLAMDNSEHVIHVGSFSKYLTPDLRLGYVVAPWQVLNQWSPAGVAAPAHWSKWAADLQNHYDEHVAALNVRLKAKRDVMIESLEANFGTTAEFDVPPGAYIFG